MTDTKIVPWAPIGNFQGTSLIPTPESLVAPAMMEIPTSLANVGHEDIQIPQLALLQGSSDEVKAGIDGARAGRFMLRPSRDTFDPPLRVMIVYMYPSRFKPDGDPNGSTMCMSKDGATGITYGSCSVCQYAKWGSSDKNKVAANGPGSSKPACSEAKNFVVLMPDGTLASVMFHRMRLKSAREHLAYCVAKRKELWSYPTILTTRLTGEGANSYYGCSIAFDMLNPTPKEWHEPIKKVMATLHQQFNEGRLATHSEVEGA